MRNISKLDLRPFFIIGAFITVAHFLLMLAMTFPFLLRSGEVEVVFYYLNHKNVGWLGLLLSVPLTAKGVLDGLFGKNGKWLFVLQALSLLLLFFNQWISSSSFIGYRLACDWLVLDYFFTALVFMPFELFFPKYKEQGIMHDEWKLNMTYFVIYDLNIKIVFFLIQYPANVIFSNEPVQVLHEFSNSLPIWLGVLLALIIADLFQYIRHFIAHKVIQIWHFHSIHHSAEKMDWLAGSRNHLLDIMVDRSFIFIPIYAMGFPPEVILSYGVVVSFQSVWVHTNSDVKLGFLKYLIVTPQYHHWHHAKHVHDKNFSIHFTYLDFLFGTYYLPKNEWPSETGIEEKSFPKGSYIGQFMHPFRMNKWVISKRN